MNINNKSNRGPLSPLRGGVVTVLACAWILAAGCGGGSGSGRSDGADPGPGTGGETQEPPPLAAPAIAFVDPTVGPPVGGTALTIVGAGFLEGVEGPVTVRIGGKDALEVEVIDDETIRCVTPDGVPETSVELRLENSRGVAILPGAFTYLASPTISSDLDGDGIADIVISAQFDGSNGQYSGCVYVFYGVAPPAFLLDMSAAAADLKIRGAAPGDRFGSAVASADVNGDGQDDLIVGASHRNGAFENTGAVYIFFGPLPQSGMLSALQADVILSGENLAANEYFGGSLAVGDVDGDLVKDLLVGAPGIGLDLDTEDALENVGAAYLFRGSSELASRAANLADRLVVGDEAEDRLGNACLLSDLNGDGLADVIVAAHLANPVLPPKRYDAGSVYVFLAGPELAGGRGADADAIFTGEGVGDQFGVSLASGDMNGDGTFDLMVGAPGNQALGSATGRAYVFYGGAELAGCNASVADAVFSGQQGNGDFARALTAGDFDGDGFADLAVGAPHNSFGAIKNGRTYVFLGSEALQDSLAHFADVIYTGEYNNGERFGSSLEVIDIDGNGLSDVMSAALGNAQAGIGSGRVYTFKGAQEPEDTHAMQSDLKLTGESPEGNFGSSISRGQ